MKTILKIIVVVSIDCETDEHYDKFGKIKVEIIF